jgi:hypothetical protein
MAQEEIWLKKKKVTAGFAIIALAGGFLFLNGGVTGNIVINNRGSFELLSLIGLLLILCSVVLAVYTLSSK